MPIKSITILTIISFLLFTGCYKKETGKNESNDFVKHDFRFHLSDSLVIHDIGYHFIADYDPQEKRFLAFDFTQYKILVLKTTGEVISTIDKSGEGPENFGIFNNMCFGEGGTLWVLSKKGIFNYSIHGDLIKKIDLPFAPVFNIVSFDKNQFDFLKINGQDYLLAYFPGRYNEYLHTDQAYYDVYKSFELINLSTGEFSPVIPFPTSSVFRERVYYLEETIPSFQVVGNELYVMYPAEPKCYVYEIGNGFKLKKVVTISPEHITFHKGESFGKNHPKEIFLGNPDLPRYESFYAHKGRLITYYRTGLSKKHYLEVYQNGRKISNDIIQSGKQGFLIFSFENKLVFTHKRDPGKEEDIDYTIFYVYELVSEN